MRVRLLRVVAILAGVLAIGPAVSQTTLPAPGFHHLHLNSTDPDAAIAFYVRQFPSTAKTIWGGMPALASPNNVLVLFSRVNTAPASDPERPHSGTSAGMSPMCGRTWRRIRGDRT
jgi:hypothetical protein